MTDLAAFLRARLDEDERDPGGWPERRVLAEVDAKRRIVAEHGAELIEVINPDGDERFGYWCSECDSEEFPCQTLRLLALPYVDHPDYRPEWAPES